ncbi:butyrophilin-like protein 2 isoform X2 [Thunnus maccoyii]|uniref:butyrophilin-like protein 2 isoform X2 n=1 Tax=Thunnus maccoyii TaxID=8240 RepID=UPI001C4C960F|nr:butyrophilin-like protein 2 isoform X2 [Thunnus maccoyii]
MAAVGEDVHLSCQLMQSKDVLQVTWQKLSPEGKNKNLATYNKHFGETVNPGFQGKVEFKDAGLQNCSIVIRKVMEQDEGCYLCLFNTYPDGSLTGRTCLQLYGLTAVIQTQQTVMAAVGEDVHLSCQLMESRDVLQVTWQKLSPDGEEKNFVGYRNLEQGVSEDFLGKVEFKVAGLQNCSIVIRKVMEQDEGCYLCLFHTFPEGSLTGRTCLQLYGLTAVIQTQQTVMAAVGEDVHLSCQLMQSRDVRQVTWQKLSPDGKKKILASYNKASGQEVIPGFQGKVEFKDAGLQHCSIVIRKVMEQDEGCYLCLFNTYPDGSLTGTTCLQLYGLTAVIQTQQTVMAAVGEDVHLSCQLMQSRDVLQVTWQKLSPEGKKNNLGSYNKYFGQKVNPGFQGKVEFKDAGLQNCSIVIRKVMEQDEGCYLCLFNTYPDGSLTGRTCLQLYELHEPILQIRESKSPEETVVSCSATGRPAPTVTLNVPQQDLYFSHNSTVSVTNTNGTVTVTTTAVLSGFHQNGAQVGCAARLLSVPEIQVPL